MKEETDFGQSRFGHPDLTNFRQSILGHRGFGPANLGQNQFWPIHLWIWCVSWWGPEGWGPKISPFVFPLSLPFSLFLSLSGCLLNFGQSITGSGWWAPRVGAQPPALGLPGLHTTARELQTCTFQGPGASNTPKIQRKDLKEKEERKKIVAGEETKSAKFWASHPSGPSRIVKPRNWPKLDGPKTRWPRMDWPKMDWPKMVK